MLHMRIYDRADQGIIKETVDMAKMVGVKGFKTCFLENEELTDTTPQR